MVANLLPEVLNCSINNIMLKNLNEIRLRVDKPVVVNILGKNFFLSKYGASADYSNAIICDKEMIDSVLENASNNSLYSVNDQIIQGFITVEGGIRIGVAGDVVSNDGQVTTIKNIRSLNIRIPHHVKNCSLNYYSLLVENDTVKNTLIVSPPGAGKTTFLRDLAYQLGKRQLGLNLLVVDERSEISGTAGDYSLLEVGDFTDVYTNCSKLYAFENGIRSMKPDVIITDEINLSDDVVAIENAVTSGVKVIASIHANDLNDLRHKNGFQTILQEKMFERYVVLSNSRGPGTVEGVFNENMVCIFCL